MSILAIMIALLALILEPLFLNTISRRMGVPQTSPSLFLVFLLTYSLILPFTIGQRIQPALQQLTNASTWQTTYSILTWITAAILVSFHFSAKAAFAAMQIVGAFVCAAQLLFIRRDLCAVGYQINCSKVNFQSIKNLVFAGTPFFILQLTSALGFSSDTFILGWLTSTSEVGKYGLLVRLSSIPILVNGIVYATAWPAFSHSYALGDIKKARKLFLTILLIGIVTASICSLIIFGFMELILRLWIGTPFSVTLDVRLGLSLWVMFNAVGGALSSFLNGIGLIKFQIIWAFFLAFSGFTFRYFGTKYFGVSGLVWGWNLAYFAFALVPSAIVVSKMLKLQKTGRLQ
jgi:O-antigen/teichoic acid export membrane protein